MQVSTINALQHSIQLFSKYLSIAYAEIVFRIAFRLATWSSAILALDSLEVK